MSQDDHLSSLRAELDELDRTLLTTAARRSEVVRRIAAAKQHANDKPLFDRERERAVYANAEKIADEVGLTRSVARQLIETVVEASHQTQESNTRKQSQEGASSPRRFLIVGGAGRMGRRLAADLAARGHVIDVIEPGDPRDRAGVVKEADIVMIAVPMHAAVDVAAEYAPLVRADALLCDINSLKSDICRVMESNCSAEVVGLHPMFGPTVRSLRRQKVVVCDVRSGPVGAWLRTELGRMGVEVIASEPEKHDRMMGVVQVLVHFSTMVMGRALRGTGVTVEESLRFTSPIYRLELAFVGRLFAQNPDLYAEIEMSNPFGAEMRRHFLEAAAAIDERVGSGDRDAFRESFEETAAWFHGFQDEAMQLSDRIIDTLVRNP